MHAVRWGVVVPVKRLPLAKTRLQELGDELRQALALAFAQDVVRAARACPEVARVLVVTDDGRVRQALEGEGVAVVADTPDRGHNAAVQYAAAQLHASLGVLALSADLPALTPQDLTRVGLQLGAGQRGFVADAEGTGTTLLAAAPGVDLRPCYGAQSRRAHLESGALELDGDPGLRQDVDTPADLAAALGLGVGPSTTQALRDHQR